MLHLILSQSTRVTDGRTDRITTPKTALAYARAVKTVKNNVISGSFASGDRLLWELEGERVKGLTFCSLLIYMCVHLSCLATEFSMC